VQSLKAEELIVLDENVEIGNDPIKRSIEEITAEILQLEKETDGILNEIVND
jgi:hypothetical protein